VCVPIRNRRSASDSGLRPVSKELALGIWKEGQPNFSWVVFGRLICTTCRRFFEKKYSNDDMRKECDELFGKCQLFFLKLFTFLRSLDWLYDCNIVHTPTIVSQSSQGQNWDINDEELNFSQENSRKQILEKALRETGFNDRIWMTSSFSTMQPHSRMNFLCQMDKVIQHVIKIFAADDYKDVQIALTERTMKRIKKKIEKKFG